MNYSLCIEVIIKKDIELNIMNNQKKTKLNVID